VKEDVGNTKNAASEAGSRAEQPRKKRFI